MSLFDLLRRWFWPTTPTQDRAGAAESRTADKPLPAAEPVKPKRRPRARLVPLRRRLAQRAKPRPRRDVGADAVPQSPYTFARPSIFGGYLDLSRDRNESRLRRFGLPEFHTPQELANWLQIPLGRLAWLVHRFDEKHRPADEKHAHYHCVWIDKRAGGQRLIEIPKPQLKAVQHKILREILDRVPPHAAAHGFITGRSIRTNAEPHVGQRVIVKSDLENFYASVGFARVVAIFRGLGYSREAAIWLARLTTSSLPETLQKQAAASRSALEPYRVRHLPQGAPTSPALANLSAFSLDIRLAGLARSFHAGYTRYADDLTFSGDKQFLKSLAVFLPLVSQVVRSERFRVNLAKRRVIRDHQRQQIAGVVVNAHPNVARAEYDRLKAILVNCIRRGPSTQNHSHHPDFAGCLRGHIAHVRHLNPARGDKLLELYGQIDWNS